MVAMTLAGVSLHLGTGSSRLVETLAARGGLAAGNVLVAASVIGASFTTTYSGSLALRAISPLSARQAVAAIAVPGLVLAVAGIATAVWRGRPGGAQAAAVPAASTVDGG